MSCCGGKRSQFHQDLTNQRIIEATNGAVHVRTVSQVVVYFQYIGPTGLTVAGPITGKRYRFNRTGATVQVDGRDAASLLAIPNLRRLSG